MPGPASPRWHTHPYNRALYYRLARLAAARLPRSGRARIAAWLGPRVAARFPAERAALRRNLARVHRHRDEAWLDAAVRTAFARFAVCFADLLSLNRGPAKELWRHVAGIDEQVPTRAALADGRGCVSLTAHLGNWALAGRLLAPLGRRVHVVMAPEVDPRLAPVLDGAASGPVEVVRLGSPVVSVRLVTALRRGDIVAFQMDRALGGRGTREVPFFDAPAPFPLGPFLLAAAAGVRVVPAFCVLEPGFAYRLRVEPAFEVARGEEEQALRQSVGVLERYVQAHWDQWFNFFDVWETPGS
jgi:lauroyl/myristoyl acyltransferase